MSATACARGGQTQGGRTGAERVKGLVDAARQRGVTAGHVRVGRRLQVHARGPERLVRRQVVERVDSEAERGVMRQVVVEAERRRRERGRNARNLPWPGGRSGLGRMGEGQYARSAQSQSAQTDGKALTSRGLALGSGTGAGGFSRPCCRKLDQNASCESREVGSTSAERRRSERAGRAGAYLVLAQRLLLDRRLRGVGRQSALRWASSVRARRQRRTSSRDSSLISAMALSCKEIKGVEKSACRPRASKCLTPSRGRTSRPGRGGSSGRAGGWRAEPDRKRVSSEIDSVRQPASTRLGRARSPCT